MHKITALICTVCTLLLIGGCATQSSKPNLSTLSSLKSLKGNPPNAPKKKTTVFRNDALKDTAIATGAQAGLAWQSGQIKVMLAKYRKYLDRVFDFRPILLENNVLPPVIIEGRSALNQSSDNTLRVADRTYLIIQQAKFVTNPPNWREHLMIQHEPPEKPEDGMLPFFRTEKKVWDKHVTEGWNLGVTQANTIFKENLARLKRNIEGMILYRKLLAQGMVSAPHVAKTNLGITGNPEEMRINDQVLRISALPQLQFNSNEWHPTIQK